jgi:hypothetical protein
LHCGRAYDKSRRGGNREVLELAPLTHKPLDTKYGELLGAPLRLFQLSAL